MCTAGVMLLLEYYLEGRAVLGSIAAHFPETNQVYLALIIIFNSLFALAIYEKVVIRAVSATNSEQA